MAAALGDLIQVIDNQTYLGQQVLNVYYYRVVAPTGLFDGYLNDFNSWFTAAVIDKVVDLQVDELSHVSREWRNMTNGVDLLTDGSVINGSQSVSPAALMPSYVSLGFLLQRESLTTRNGYKRFAGIGDATIEGNTVPLPNASITAVEAALAADIMVGLAAVAEPIIVKRPIQAPVASYLYSSIGSATFRGVGTQNTRKAGRGV